MRGQQAHAEFSPTSVRLFVPPLPVTELQSIIGDSLNNTASAQPYYRPEDWTADPKWSAVHVGEAGPFLKLKTAARTAPANQALRLPAALV
ncbi:MAG TPA: hypothetical protein VG013_37335 [Gemmataceae bacterium]|jgi:hypothetical protein|nr:hypothetical protein [Gemmataceae bacterium]